MLARLFAFRFTTHPSKWKHIQAPHLIEHRGRRHIVPEDSQTASTARYSTFPTAGNLKDLIFEGESTPDNCISIICLLFGGTHLVGWNFSFVSRAEQILWRISSIIVLAIFPLPISFNGFVLVSSQGYTNKSSSSRLPALKAGFGF